MRDSSRRAALVPRECRASIGFAGFYPPDAPEAKIRLTRILSILFNKLVHAINRCVKSPAREHSESRFHQKALTLA
jgi:hypothetical protein